MNNNNILLLGAALTALTIILIRKNKKDKKDNEAINNVVTDTTDAAKQAIQLKELLNVNDNLGFWTYDSVKKSSRKIQLFNLMLSITDWAKVQKDFLTLTKNKIALINVLQSACDTETFNKAIHIATAQKVICTADNTGYIKDPSKSNLEYVNFKQNTILGALQTVQGSITNFIYQYIDTGIITFELKEVVGTIKTKNCKLIKPV